MRKLFTLVLMLVIAGAQAQKQITVDDFTTRPTFSQKSVSGINWMKDGKFYSSQDDNKIVKYNVTTGQPVETIVDGDALNPKVAIQDYDMSGDEKKILLMTDFQSIYRRSFKAEYYIYDLTTKQVQKLSNNGKQSYATFSPDGSKVAFVRDNNLFYVDIAAMTEVQVTNDGKFNFIINGSTDWVYEEEFSFAKAFYWSPDSKRLAYHRFDESAVKEYNLQKWNKGQLYPEDYRFKYPKAGEANSVIEIWMYDIASQQKVKADIGAEKDIYIPRVQWTSNASILSVRRLNRLQNNLDILHVDAATGNSKVVLNEKNAAYVDIDYCDDLQYLQDGKHFVFSSEQNGNKHLYLYTMEGKLVNQITSGNWEMTQFLGMDEKTKTVYYISTEGNHLGRQFYAISLDGKKKTKLSTKPGTHSVNISSDFQFYIDYQSALNQPLEVSLYKMKGNALVKVLESNETLKKTVQEYGVLPKELFTFKTVEGIDLHGLMIKPKNFDATKKYPVLLYQYSGPRSQNVTDSWGGGHFYFHQMLAQQGYLIVVVDTRGTGYRGERFVKMTYKELGKYELEDLVEASKYLSSLSYVDKDRLGVWGWSYGGYMSSLAMTKGAGSYKTGIAVAPVTNWRFYDNIYTERYMQRPQENASGYDGNSPTTHANKLQGNFFLIHGTGDDNVHFQNSVVLEDGLVNAGKQFRSFYYPDKNHGMAPGIRTRAHLYTMMLEYLVEKL
jgi:dipeptidyl-peptidase-4